MQWCGGSGASHTDNVPKVLLQFTVCNRARDHDKEACLIMGECRHGCIVIDWPLMSDSESKEGRSRTQGRLYIPHQQSTGRYTTPR